MMEISKEQHYIKKVLSKDDTVFREYIENTTTHGVVRIFNSSYFIFRRLFWLVIVLGAAVGCLNNCIERIRFLASGPTSTSISIRRMQPLDFPAVTICNHNPLTVSGLNQSGLLDIARETLNIDPGEPDEVQHCTNLVNSSQASINTMLEDLIYNGGQNLSNFVLNCTFLGRACDLEHDFEPVISGLGLCYTFNGYYRNPILKTKGTGTRQGLLLFLNIEQEEYVASQFLDAGVGLSIHPQSEPPKLDQGISIPPGRVAFVGVTQQRMVDNVRRRCNGAVDTNQFNFFSNFFNYSSSACLTDCLFTEIANTCRCLHVSSVPPNNLSYATLPRCTFSDTCCIQEVLSSAITCDCLAPCESTSYSTFTSYSAFPAEYARGDLQYLLEVLGSEENVQNNVMVVSVYYESLNVETFTTNSAYNAVALLSDIGGQLGLFLGVSIISILEFGTWVLDEVKNRFCCLRCRWKMKKKKLSGGDGDEVVGQEKKKSLNDMV